MRLNAIEKQLLNREIDYHEFIIRENFEKIKKLSQEIKDSKILIRLCRMNIQKGEV